MVTNQRSMQLLQSTSNKFAKFRNKTQSYFYRSKANYIRPAPKVYDRSLKQYTNYSEALKTKVTTVQNISSSHCFQKVLLTQSKIIFPQKYIKKLQERLLVYKQLIVKYKEELLHMNEHVDRLNDESIDLIKPLIKSFHMRLRKMYTKERNQQYQQQREIDNLNRQKMKLQDKVHYAHNRIKHLEKIVGIKGDELIKKPVIESFDENENSENESDY